jgi:prepilin-type N-terminal cleavage/methylation domain-containing protein
MYKTKGFTLIELLIVVAIIAILAAIAVPNFLEAQTRAKVSRAKADMRSTAVAIESYAVDNNRYPWPADAFGAVLTVPTQDWFETKVGPNLTTPIAYQSSRFPDVFHPTSSPDEDPVFHLITRAYTIAEAGSDTPFDNYILTLLGSNQRSVRYILLSHGPDISHEEPGDPDPPALYDPTNGTISRGDILYFGPGIGFRN